MFAIEHNMVKEYSWIPTFSASDKQPFGCYVFDDVLTSSLKGNYSVSTETFYQLDQDSVNAPRAFLLVSNDMEMDSVDINSMTNLLDKGNKVMIVSSSFPYNLTDSLNIKFHKSYFDLNALRLLADKGKRQGTLVFCDSAVAHKSYNFYSQLLTDYFWGVDSIEPEYKFTETDDQPLTEDDYLNPEDAKKNPLIRKSEEQLKYSRLAQCPTTVLVRNKQKYVVAFSKKVGNGELFMVANPLLFTNYGILDKGNAGYIFGLLSHMKGMPLVRLGNDTKEMEQITPLRYFLTQTPLKWSVYLSLISLVLFMCFTARRRQRVIPLIYPLRNTTLDFVKQIGTLYHQDKKYLEVLRKKKSCFVQALKKETGVDLSSEQLTVELCQRLSDKTGMDADVLYAILKKLELLEYDVDIDEKELKEYIDKMNEIIINSTK